MDTKDTIIEYLRAQVAALQSELEKRDNPMPKYTSTLTDRYLACYSPIKEVIYGN